MNFIIAKYELFKAISKVRGIPSRSSSLPALTHLHIMTKEDGVFITASDLEVTLRVNTKAEVFDEGSITLPHEPFFKIIKKMADEDISFEGDKNNRVKISCGNATFNLMGLPGEDFPAFPDTILEDGLIIHSKTLGSMLEKTVFAASRHEGMANLSGVFAEISGDNGNKTLCMVATDGHRLAKVETPSRDGVPALQKGVIIPLKGGMELLRMAKEIDDDIELKVGKSSLSSCVANETLIMRLVDVKFPDYRTVMDSIDGSDVLSDRESFKECLERTYIMAHGHGRHVSLNLTDKDRLVIKAFNHDLGDAEDSLPVKSELAEISISLNADYLLEGLRVMKSKDINIMLKDPKSAALITGKEDEGFRYVVMPLRT
jgi:DNA polymerase III subunit beta